MAGAGAGGPRTALPERIVLIGFMGAGKSTVGALLAARLGWELVDTDTFVAARAGAPVAEIFRERGEAAFRQMEAEVLETVGAGRRLVVATGGGAPVQARNAAFFGGPALTIHLKVSLATALQRARAAGTGAAPRPLLAQEEGAVRALFENRRPVYEKLGIGVETEGREPAAIVEEIVRLLEDPRGSLPGGNA
jgi:shikimate kinase